MKLTIFVPRAALLLVLLLVTLLPDFSLHESRLLNGAILRGLLRGLVRNYTEGHGLPFFLLNDSLKTNRISQFESNLYL